MSLKEQLEAILADKRANLLPSNIRMGKTIMGVKGILPPPADNRTVKLFKTTEEMNSDSAPEVNDLAVVYGKEPVSVLTSNYTELHLPKTITFDTAIEHNECRGYIDNQGFFTEVRVSFNPTHIYVEVYTNNRDFSILYDSTDGIHYVTEQTELDFVSQYTLPILKYMNESPERMYDVSWLNAKMLYFSGVYQYNGNEYVPAATQFSLSDSNQLLNNLVAYGKNGSIQGDGSYINNIPNVDFINHYIGDSYTNKSNSMYQNGSMVPNQTFVEKLYYSNNIETSNDDCIAYSSVTDIVETDYTTNQYFNTNWTYRTSTSEQRDDKIYYMYAGFIGTKTKDTYGKTCYTQVTKIGYVIINVSDNVLVKSNIFDCNFRPTHANSTNTDKYASDILNICITKNLDGIYLFWGTTVAWDNGAYFGITSVINNVSHNQYSYNSGMSGKYRYFSIAKWNYVDNNFICEISHGSSSNGYAHKLTKVTLTGGVTSLVDIPVGKYMVIYGTNDGSARIVSLYNSNDNTYKIYDTKNAKYLSDVTSSSNSYRIIRCDNNYIMCVYNTTTQKYDLYKYDIDTGIFSLLVENSGDGTLYALNIDGIYAIKCNNKIYNIETGEIINAVIPTNNSSYFTRIVQTNEHNVTDVYPIVYSTDNGKIKTTKYSYTLYIYRDIVSFPISGVLCIAISGKNSNTSKSTVYKSNCFELTSSMTGPITQEEYNTAVATTEDILGNTTE